MSSPLARTVGIPATNASARLLLRTAFGHELAGPIDLEVAAAVEEERRDVLVLGPQRVYPTDEQVVVTDRNALGDGALEGRDRPVDERQATLAGMPCGATEGVETGLHGRSGEAVREGLLALAEDVDCVATRCHDVGMARPQPPRRVDPGRPVMVVHPVVAGRPG